jgi:cytochrome c
MPLPLLFAQPSEPVSSPSQRVDTPAAFINHLTRRTHTTMQQPHHILQQRLAAMLLLACTTSASASTTAMSPAAKTPASSAQSGHADIQALAARKACLNCHNVDHKVIGPAFKDVANRYRKQADAEKKLVAKVLQGGSGAWGPVAMPANRQVDEAQARQLVHWVLSLK